MPEQVGIKPRSKLQYSRHKAPWDTLSGTRAAELMWLPSKLAVGAFGSDTKQLLQLKT